MEKMVVKVGNVFIEIVKNRAKFYSEHPEVLVADCQRVKRTWNYLKGVVAHA